MLEDVTNRIVAFRDRRDWKQFHSPRNLAASISIEAAELLELFQWSSDASLSDDVESRHEDLKRELADIAIYTLLMAHETTIDLEAAIIAKLAENEAKYPAEKAKGSREKYDRLA
jgi:NTP pyrophosphatase (non-canonical NTP hydrolase)